MKYKNAKDIFPEDLLRHKLRAEQSGYAVRTDAVKPSEYLLCSLRRKTALNV